MREMDGPQPARRPAPGSGAKGLAGRSDVMGPLMGIRVVEMAGIGPGPFAGMLLSDLGAEVIRVDRPGGGGTLGANPAGVTGRGRRSIAVNLKHADGVEAVLRLVEKADLLIEGFRPGVMERNGLGPEVCLERNPRLIYGRMTGWGQEGPLAQTAGHDINYISLTGVLHSIGPKDGPPIIPLNLAGDFGGGGMMMAFGVLAAYIEAQKSGKGQVVDTAMVDASSLLMTFMHGLRALGLHRDERGSNLLDGGAPFYDVYETVDKQYISIGPIEAHFYQELIQRLGYGDDPLLQQQLNMPQFEEIRAKLAAIFRTKTRDAWCELLEGTDVCFAPVLSMAEAPEHHHAKARNAFVEINGITQPAPAPRFSRTPGQIQNPPPLPGEHSEDLLRAWGFSEERIQKLIAAGTVVQRANDAS